MTVSASAEFAALVLQAWQGEVYGVEVYVALAEQQRDPDNAAKLRVLAELEDHMEGRLSRLLDEVGIEADLGDVMAVADEDVRVQAIASWDDLMRWLGADAETALTSYVVMQDFAPADDGIRNVVADVIAHERALITFCERERAGDPDSLAAVRAMLPGGSP